MPVKSRNLRKKRKCPIGLWGVLTDRPLPPGHPKYNSFQGFLRPGEWSDHKTEVINYWANKEVPRGKAKAIFLRRERLLTDKELKMIKKNYNRG